MSKQKQKHLSAKQAKLERKARIAPRLAEDRYHFLEAGDYMYEKRWNGNLDRWEIAEYTLDAWDRMQDWRQRQEELGRLREEGLT